MIRVGDSQCEGQGLFALVPIASGTKIIQYKGEKISKEVSEQRKAAYNNYIFHFDFNYDIDGASLENTARFVNHSCDPNCAIEKSRGEIWVVASRDIQPGEELSFNYGYDARDYERFPCNCGARVCCGYILGREHWGEIAQPRGKGTFSAWGEGSPCE